MMMMMMTMMRRRRRMRLLMMMMMDSLAIWIFYGNFLVLPLLRVHGFEERTPQGKQILHCFLGEISD